MSMYRQLWLAIIISTLLALSGSLLASMLSARGYLESQLSIKNSDNAAALALSLSQSHPEAVSVELAVAALFDSGHYELIRVVDPLGKTIVERIAPPGELDAPAWFVHRWPINAAPGQAQISHGWKQFGTVSLVSHSRFAYGALWKSAYEMTGALALAGLIGGYLGSLVLRRLRRPLNAVIAQATAISERRFVRIDEPAVPELRQLAIAMNATVGRLKSMFEEEAARLETVRREATLDSLTGLANRAYFMNQLDMALHSDDLPASGTLFILRLADLAGINKRSGREAADDVLCRTGKVIAETAAGLPGALPARLNGADFGLLVPGLEEPAGIADGLLDALRNMVSAGLLDSERVGHVAAGHYHHEDSPGSLLARIDAALAAAENQGAVAWSEAASGGKQGVSSNADWRKLLEGAIDSQRLRLVEFPVAGRQGQILHLECPLRLQATENGEWLAAGSFMPMAARLAMTTELDLAAARLALDRIAAGVPAVAVNLSGESIREARFRDRLHGLINARKELAARLWLEVPEIGAFQHFAAFREFCNAIRPLGCRLGIEHFGRQFSQIGQLHDIGLDYLKVDGSFVRGIDQQPGNQAFLKGLCGIAHNIGLTVIAEAVQTADELAVLPELGFDGATGPAVPRG